MDRDMEMEVEAPEINEDQTLEQTVEQTLEHEEDMTTTDKQQQQQSSSNDTIKLTKPPDFEPPFASINRIVKQILPENIQIAKECRAAFTRAAGIFIFYLTHCSNEYSRDGKRSTIQTNDILNALKELGFEEFLDPLQEFIEAYRKDAESKKGLKAASKGTSSSGNTDDFNEADGGTAVGDGDGDGDDGNDDNYNDNNDNDDDE